MLLCPNVEMIDVIDIVAIVDAGLILCNKLVVFLLGARQRYILRKTVSGYLGHAIFWYVAICPRHVGE